MAVEKSEIEKLRELTINQSRGVWMLRGCIDRADRSVNSSLETLGKQLRYYADLNNSDWRMIASFVKSGLESDESLINCMFSTPLVGYLKDGFVLVSDFYPKQGKQEVVYNVSNLEFYKGPQKDRIFSDQDLGMLVNSKQINPDCLNPTNLLNGAMERLRIHNEAKKADILY